MEIEHTRCGILCHPPCLQKCSRLSTFIASFGVAVMVTQCLLTYMSTQMTTLERQFGLTSAQSGFIYSCNDIGFMVVILVVSYFATKVHIPRFLSGATLLFAAAAVVCSLPYFISREALHGRVQTNSQIPTTQLEHRIIAELRQYDRSLSDQNITLSTEATAVHISSLNSTHSQYNPNYMSTFKNNSNDVAKRIYELLKNTTHDQQAKVSQQILQTGFTESIAAKVKSMLEQMAGDKSRSYMYSSIKQISRFQLMLAAAQVCSNENKTSNCAAMRSRMNPGLRNDYTAMAYGILIVGMVLQGVAKSPRLSMGLLYMDDNGERSHTPFYIGYVFTMIIVGIILSFSLGTVASKLYVTLEDVDIHPQSPQWIGAWWLGFLIIGALSVISAIPLMCFPRRMRIAHEAREPPDRKTSSMHHLEEFIVIVKRLVVCPVYMGCVFASVLQLLWAAGSIPFAPKYLETQFSIPAWKANMITGLLKIGSAMVGSLVTGIYLSRRKVHPVTMLKIVVGLVTCSLILGLLQAFVFGCETPTIVGYNDYRSDNATHNAKSCGEACHCDADEYFPVCGSDGRNYFSACHAGCQEVQGMVFGNCLCVGEPGTAKPGLCPSTCRMLVPYLVVSVIIHFNFACAAVMNIVVKLRAVKDGDRAMALGFSSLLTNLLGWVPGPIIFGKLLDSTCLLWKQSCAMKGSCAIYDIHIFRISVNLLFVALSVVILGITCFVLYKATQKTHWNFDAELLRPSRNYEKATGETLEALMAKSPETNV